MKNNVWKIVGGVAIAAIFGARIYFANEQKKDRAKQQQMMEELSRMQSEQFRKDYSKNLDSITSTLAVNLDSIQRGLDSLGKKMKADQEAFEKKMKQ